MEIRNNKDGNIITVSDEKWASLRSSGWDKYWTPVRKVVDENMAEMIASISKPIEVVNKKKKKVEEIKIEDLD